MEGKKTISISGSSSFSGGTYDAIQISGSGKCAEPFTANSVRVSGSSSLATVEAGEMRISGSAKFSGRVSAEKMSVSGVCKIEEDCEAANLQLSGSMYARKGLRGTNGSVSGSIHVDGDMEFEQLTISGAAEVSGLMNAESLTIHLGGSCEIGEIGGSEIFVDVPPRHAGFLAKLLGGFAVPTLKCGTIEGERIRPGKHHLRYGSRKERRHRPRLRNRACRILRRADGGSGQSRSAKGKDERAGRIRKLPNI